MAHYSFAGEQWTWLDLARVSGGRLTGGEGAERIGENDARGSSWETGGKGNLCVVRPPNRRRGGPSTANLKGCVFVGFCSRVSGVKGGP